MSFCLNPNRYRIATTITLFLFLAVRASGTTYYVSPAGNDTADGKSPQNAWKSIGQVWSVKLTGSDELLLRRGGVWHQDLTIPADGTPGKPIIVSAYGKGERPSIDGGDFIDPSKFHTTKFDNVFVVSVDHPIADLWNMDGSPLTSAKSQADVALHVASFFSDATQLYINPGKGRDPRSGKIRFELPVREFGIEISKSHVELRSLAICHAARADRGAVSVWADHDLTGIEIRDCLISNNCGRGVWFCGPPASSVHDIVIDKNIFSGNDGSGASLVLADGANIIGNTFRENCRLPLEFWQAGIRLWSAGVLNVNVSGNTITDEHWGHDHDSAIGIHCDETGPRVVIANNQIREVDHAGIEVENTRGVIVENNKISDCNIGIFINRAGHDHIIRGNIITDSRSQGIALQGWRANGIDAQPEILVDGRLLTRNLIENNKVSNSHWANLKAIKGGENIDFPLGNIFRNNDLGSERQGFIEWGDKTLDRYNQWPVSSGTNR